MPTSVAREALRRPLEEGLVGRSGPITVRKDMRKKGKGVRIVGCQEACGLLAIRFFRERR